MFVHVFVCLGIEVGSRTTRRRTIRLGQYVAKYNINFIESTASISAAFFSSIPLPLQQHYFHHTRFHLRNILLINLASISAKLFSSLPRLFQLHFFHLSRFHFSNILFINPTFIS